MRVSRIGRTPVKGLAHPALAHLDLADHGPVGDRAFCFVDAASGRVLRTVQDDVSMACSATWEPPHLTINTPVGDATGEVIDSAADAPVVGDYWGREVKLTSVNGPWSSLMGRYLGRAVTLCRVQEAGSVVWAGPVSLVSTSSLAELAQRIGRVEDDGARFRPTVVVDTAGAPPFIEDTWVGARLRLGRAVVAVRERLPRCAVVDRQPARGGPDAAVLKALAPDRTDGTEIMFGVSGEVHQAGKISLGDPVELVAGAVHADGFAGLPSG